MPSVTSMTMPSATVTSVKISDSDISEISDSDISEISDSDISEISEISDISDMPVPFSTALQKEHTSRWALLSFEKIFPLGIRLTSGIAAGG